MPGVTKELIKKVGPFVLVIAPVAAFVALSSPSKAERQLEEDVAKIIETYKAKGITK